MKIVIEDTSMAEELDRKALTAVRGGVANLQLEAKPVWPWPTADFPHCPSFPSGFPFTGPNPVGQPVPQVVDPSNPLLV